MGSWLFGRNQQSPSPDPSKGWMCNLIPWTGSSREPMDSSAGIELEVAIYWASRIAPKQVALSTAVD
jgi:hypothetical protein